MNRTNLSLRCIEHDILHTFRFVIVILLLLEPPLLKINRIQKWIYGYRYLSLGTLHLFILLLLLACLTLQVVLQIYQHPTPLLLTPNLSDLLSFSLSIFFKETLLFVTKYRFLAGDGNTYDYTRLCRSLMLGGWVDYMKILSINSFRDCLIFLCLRLGRLSLTGVISENSRFDDI